MLTLLLLTSNMLIADIPRLDILEVSYQNQRYFLGATVAHLEFKEGCVFDIHNEEYLYEQEDFFSAYIGPGYVILYRDLIAVPKQKFSKRLNRMIVCVESCDSIYFLLEPYKKLAGASLDSMSFINIFIGNTAGMTFTKTLSKADQDWIMDYPLESILKTNDKELCDLELFAIKGNVTKQEARHIKKEIDTFYSSLHSRHTSLEISPEDYFAKLLKRHILMIGFCSC